MKNRRIRLVYKLILHFAGIKDSTIMKEINCQEGLPKLHAYILWLCNFSLATYSWTIIAMPCTTHC